MFSTGRGACAGASPYQPAHSPYLRNLPASDDKVTCFAGTYASKMSHREIERLAIQAAQVAFKQPEQHEQAFKDFGIRMATQLSAGLGPPSDMSQHNT